MAQIGVIANPHDEIDAPSDEGLSRVEVIIVDADDLRWTTTSNRAGNFYFSAKMAYPLTVKIRRGDIVSTMQTRIWRNGSCAHCHGPEPDEASVGRVFVDEEMTP